MREEIAKSFLWKWVWGEEILYYVAYTTAEEMFHKLPEWNGMKEEEEEEEEEEEINLVMLQHIHPKT